MRIVNRFVLILAVLLACGGIYTVSGAEAETSAATEEKSTIPDSTDMTLGVVDNEFVMPEGFRGNESDSGDIHWLEDVGYLMAENSGLYNTDPAAIAENAKFEGPPNITWEVKEEDSAGNMQTQSTDNSNVASAPCNITNPGYYEVHNGGSRQVSDAGGAVEDGSTTTTEGGESGGGSESGTTGSTEEGKESSGETKTVTAQQVVGIKVHDCTSPDLWVAFQEGAGKVDMAESEEELKAKMAEKMVANLGRPFSTNADDFQDASFLFVEEGEEDERNSIPWEKTARLSIAGNLFNELGAPKFESGVLPAKIDKKDYKNDVTVAGGPGKNLAGVFVRRNVPFIFAAMATDNGNKRASAGLAVAKIEYADGKEVEKDGDGYLFRVPNYPREKYEDQPEYFFTVFTADKDGNSTSVKMPLYVVDNQAAFEGGRNE
ncbi:MAG: hypothetical protein AB1403_14250 [Candidatus Riflebacteria bacterium]